ncbi:MAG: hypothetical protein WCW61_00780 [Patescibacteria group bacterium]|jgi:hypothetical protein
MNTKILVITIGLFVLIISIGGIIFLSPKNNESSSKQLPSGFINSHDSYCNTVSDCRKIAGYDAEGCATCSENVGNVLDEQNYTFGKPSNSSDCPMLDCYIPPVNHLACVDNKCILVKNSTISDCNNNIQCLLIYARENNDRSICEKIKEISPNYYDTCLFRFAKSIEDCNELSKKLNLPIDDRQLQDCFVYNAKIKTDCEFIKEAYEKNKCLAETATTIRECEFIEDTTNGRSWCYTRTENVPPESIDDCNLLLEIRDEPINCINNFIRYNSEKTNLEDSCYKLKNQKSVDYCLTQVSQ